MKDTLIEFRQFVLRGSIIELAVAFVIAVAFTTVVGSVVDNILMPLIGAVFGERNFSFLDFTINDSVFTYGLVINAVLTFIAIGAALFFFVVKPLKILQARMASGDEPAPEPTEEVTLLREIRDLLSRTS